MAEKLPGRSSDGSTPSAPKATDSQLRLVTPDDPIVGPGTDEPTDDTPTIITKHQPSTTHAITAQAENIAANLRGRILAHFELLGPIGVGGMAAVLQARDTQLDRLVALKILPPEMAADPDNIQRFHQEARAAAKLDHENIARVFYCGEDQNLHFIAFEFVEGENLRTVLERRGRLPVPEAVHYVLQIAAGLEHASARGVVHRDIKPSNIIISPNGRAKLVDMGLARTVDLHKDQGLTHSGVTLGTFDYISPEQALEPREADTRSDIYSLGCTFYHMLTGQAPVPEGTAAKKLHHHQHVPPLDPRQLNPAIPDEVALILARMMAKDPKRRYQRAVHLVQHLYQVAHKVGAAAHGAETVLFVEAPLPSPPRQRPLLVVSLAALALGVVLAILSLAPLPQNTIVAVKPPTKDSKDKRIPAKDSGAIAHPKTGGPQPEAHRPVVRTEDQLKKMLADPKHEMERLAGIIELPAAGLIYKGQGASKLTLTSADELEPAQLKFKPVNEGSEAAGLTIEVEGNATLVLSNLTFDLESSFTPDALTAMIAIRGAGTVRFEKCTFVQKAPLRPLVPLLNEYRLGTTTKQPLASVLIDNTDGNLAQRPNVHFERCVFKGQGGGLAETGGQVAIGVHGPAQVTTTDCAFRPHLALFHVRGDHKGNATSLTMERCSAMVVYGPVFCLDDHAHCALKVVDSIFSCPEQNITYGEPDLIRQVVAPEPLARFNSAHNCFNLLNKFLYTPKIGGGAKIDISAKSDNLPQFLTLSDGTDDGSQFLDNGGPFATPKADIDKAAFALRPDLKENRFPPDLVRPLGPQRCVWGEVAALPPLVEPPIAAPLPLKVNEKLVDPDYKGPNKAVFRSVELAVKSADPGDVVYIKPGKDGRTIEVDPIRLDTADNDVTLRPWHGTNPILTLAITSERDAAFFILSDGKVQCEDLEFVAEPNQVFRALGIALISGNAHCTFKNCVLTLKQTGLAKASKRVPLSVVTLTDLDDDSMMMPARPPRTAPEIFITDCFVRGEGDVLTLRASRPFRLELKNSLVGLAGSLAVIHGAAKEPAADNNADGRIVLSKSSLFLTEPLVWLKANMKGKGLLPTLIESARECLLTGLSDRPMILLQGTDLTEATFRTVLDWKGERNAYCNYELMLDHLRGDVDFSTFQLKQPRWMELLKERPPETKYLIVEFEYANKPLRSLWLELPDFFLPVQEFRPHLMPFGTHPSVDTLPKMIPTPKVDKAP